MVVYEQAHLLEGAGVVSDVEPDDWAVSVTRQEARAPQTATNTRSQDTYGNR